MAPATFAHVSLRLTDGAARYSHTLQEEPGAVVLSLLVGGMCLAYIPACSCLLWGGWIATQLLLKWRPSCCRATGVLAMVLYVVGLMLTPKPDAPIHTPFWELETCMNGTVGAFRAFAMRGGIDAAAMLPDTPCPVQPTSSQSSSLSLALDEATAAADTWFKPIILLETGSYARLVVGVEDGLGRPLLEVAALPGWPPAPRGPSYPTSAERFPSAACRRTTRSLLLRPAPFDRRTHRSRSGPTTISPGLRRKWRRLSRASPSPPPPRPCSSRVAALRPLARGTACRRCPRCLWWTLRRARAAGCSKEVRRMRPERERGSRRREGGRVLCAVGSRRGPHPRIRQATHTRIRKVTPTGRGRNK